LGVNDVKALLASIFPDEVEYVRAIGENRINGFVLTSIDCKSPQSLSKLKGYGISSEIHADVLRMHLSQWVQSGVPIRYLADHSSRSSKAAIKPEQCRSSSSSSSSSAVPTNHTKSRDIHNNDQDRHSDVPMVSNPIEAFVSHHDESRSERSDALPAAVAHPDEVMDFDVAVAHSDEVMDFDVAVPHSDEVMDFDVASFGNTMSLVFNPNNSAKSHLVCNHPNAALPTDDRRRTRSKGGNVRCAEASANPISKRKEDGLLSASDRVVNKRHKPQVQVSDTDAAGSRLSSHSSATASALLHPDDSLKGLSLRGSSSSSRPPTSRALVASSDGAPASSGGKAAAASSSSSRPFNFFFIAGYRVPSPDDLLDHRDNTKLQALCWLASLVKSKVSEGWYHHLDDDKMMMMIIIIVMMIMMMIMMMIIMMMLLQHTVGATFAAIVTFSPCMASHCRSNARLHETARRRWLPEDSDRIDRGQ
jgi:hypothetical protein